MDRFLKSVCIGSRTVGEERIVTLTVSFWSSFGRNLWRGRLFSVKADNASEFQKRISHLGFSRRDLAMAVAKLPQVRVD